MHQIYLKFSNLNYNSSVVFFSLIVVVKTVPAYLQSNTADSFFSFDAFKHA